MALGLEEGEDHAAADQQLVGLAEQVVDDPELVGDLGAAEHDDVGPLRALGEPLHHLELGRRPARPWRAAAAARRRRRDACLRCTTPKPSETNASASAASRSAKAPRSASSLLVSPALNRTFSSTRDLAVPQRVDHGLALLPHRVGGEGDVRRRAARRGGPRPAPASTPGPGAPLGRPRWAVTTTRAPASGRSRIVGTLARMRPSSVIRPPVERDVQVASGPGRACRRRRRGRERRGSHLQRVAPT